MSLDVALVPSGDLPAGVHRASLSALLERFGSETPWRRLLGDRIRRIHEAARSTGCLHRFIVFGSFVTAASGPNDVDVFLLMTDNFDVSRVSGDAALVFDHQAAQAFYGASVFWMRRLAALGGEDEAIAFWQVKRDGTRRGIVEVVEGPR